MCIHVKPVMIINKLPCRGKTNRKLTLWQSLPSIFDKNDLFNQLSILIPLIQGPSQATNQHCCCWLHVALWKPLKYQNFENVIENGAQTVGYCTFWGLYDIQSFSTAHLCERFNFIKASKCSITFLIYKIMLTAQCHTK